MTQVRRRKRSSPSHVVRSWATVSLLFAIGCSSAPDDRKFGTPSYDEYTEPLNHAVIGEGTVRIVIPEATADAGGGPITKDAGSGAVDAGIADTGVAGAGGSGSTGTGGSGMGGAVGRDGGVFGSGPSGFWRFDDCSPGSHFLLDSSGNNFSAQHALSSFCVDGISGLGVQFKSAKDIVQVPDEPQFTVGPRIAVAAWVNPTTVDGDQPIVIKRENKTTAFSLGIHKGKIEMAVQLTNGTTVISRANIVPNKWTHVAGMYDGQFVFLFRDGEQVGQVEEIGTLQNAFAPIRIGATTQTQFFNGVIDEVWLSTNPVSKDQLIALSCISRPAMFAVSPATSGPVSPGTTVRYDVSVTNNDIGACQPNNYEMFVLPSFSGGGIDAGSGSTTTSSSVSTTTGPIGKVDPVALDAGPAPIEGGMGQGGFGGSSGVATTGSSVSVTTGGGGSVTTGGAGSVGSGGAGGSSGGGDLNAGITTFVNPPFFFGVTPGSTVKFEADVTGSEDAEPGVHRIPFEVFSFGGPNFTTLIGQLVYELTAPTGCFVRTKRELMITDTSIVDDPMRTAFGPVPSPSRGVWTFGRLMRDLAPTPEDAPALALNLFQNWLTDQTVNGFTVFARPAIQQILLDNWPRLADNSLDLDRSPLRLLAIVNRLDLRNLAAGNAGEGRFVFGVLGPGGFPQQFTVILEYKLPAQTEQDVIDWANRWHMLQTHPFPSEEYNAALEAITLRFSGRGAAPGRVNDNALGQLRTNEIALSGFFGRWELREFVLSPTTGFLQETTVKLTPDLGFNQTPTLADFVNQNEPAILAETHTVPEQFEGGPFLAGSVFNDLIEWGSFGIQNNEARFHFSVNTCNGCHGPETNTTFLQISPRFPGQEAPLSPFLTGTTAFDFFSGQTRTLNDLARRKTDLTGVVCGMPGADAGPSLSKGVQRAD